MRRNGLQLWFIGAVSLGLLACGGGEKPATGAPSSPLINQKSQSGSVADETKFPGKQAWFGPEPWVYRWQDHTVEGLEKTHFGTVLFLRDGQRVVSYAWPLRSENNWPWVEGSGTWDAKERLLRIAYRSASGLHDHDFYHAVSEFYFNEDGSTFEVQFRQRINDDEEAPMEPGMAKGARAEDASKLDRDRQAILRRMTKVIAPWSTGKGVSGCAVLPHVAARGDVFVEYRDKKYYFCCPSCRDVFLHSPKTFLTTDGDRGNQKKVVAEDKDNVK